MKILLAEDELPLSHAYATALTHHGYQVVTVFNGADAVTKAQEEAFDVMIFDVMMPVKSGLEAVAEIRARGNKTYIIMLTALGELEDKITGLENGADDYLSKPISLKELLARLASLERRFESYAQNVLSLGNLTLNVADQEMQAQNSIRLSGKECLLLEFLMTNADKNLSTTEIYQHLCSRLHDEEFDEGYVYIYISYLRQKLKSIQAHVCIEGEENRSYRLIPTE